MQGGGNLEDSLVINNMRTNLNSSQSKQQAYRNGV
jgi:hypothetical protein